jgi:hypothetical protein
MRSQVAAPRLHSCEGVHQGDHMNVFKSPATAEAMAVDGVKRETAQLFVLDKELPL